MAPFAGFQSNNRWDKKSTPMGSELVKIPYAVVQSSARFSPICFSGDVDLARLTVYHAHAPRRPIRNQKIEKK